MRTYLGFLWLLVPGFCFADAQFSIVRDVKRGGQTGTQAIALFCGKDAPALADCKIFRSRDGVAEKTKPVAADAAQEILAAAEKKLGPFAVPTDAPDDPLRWNIAYAGKNLSGGALAKDAKARKALTASLMTLETRLAAELDP